MLGAYGALFSSDPLCILEIYDEGPNCRRLEPDISEANANATRGLVLYRRLYRKLFFPQETVKNFGTHIVFAI